MTVPSERDVPAVYLWREPWPGFRLDQGHGRCDSVLELSGLPGRSGRPKRNGGFIHESTCPSPS